MISRLTGALVGTTQRHVVLDVSGVGYKVAVTPDTARALGKEKGPVTLITHLAVREDALDLYGFLLQDELDLFEMLIGVSGIGPKSALQILSLAGIETLKKAISSEDTSYLTKVSGIGKKTAEKIVLELKDKLGGGTGRHGELREESDAVEALKSLGYSQSEARDALKSVKVEGTGNRVKEALKVLGNGR
ncbi:Holliday junction branch migration protein RuvA [Candidatus Parcubacteria bacterium]|nr:Holliday junction branch migration protein RuvA [Candidatus Parcubacteria bacterium]